MEVSVSEVRCLGIQRGDNGGFVCDTISAGMLGRNQTREANSATIFECITVEI